MIHNILIWVMAVGMLYGGIVILRIAWRIATDKNMIGVRGDGVHLVMIVLGIVLIICAVAIALNPWVV